MSVDDMLPEEINAAFELRETARHREQLRRQAARYLDEHCDHNGQRVPGNSLSQEEFGAEVGISPDVLAKLVRAERRRRGLKAGVWGGEAKTCKPSKSS